MDSFGFKFVFLLHILAIIVAFAPAFVWPLIGRNARKQATGAPGAATATTAPTPGGIVARVLSVPVHGGALVLAGLFGLALIGLSDGAFKMSKSWVSIALLLWFLMLVVLSLGLYPTERKLANIETPSERRVAIEQRLSMLYGAMHLLLLLQIIDMIWKPGQ